MAYKPNIPLATDKISQSQSDINANFTAIDTVVGINHSAFGTATEGKHKHVSFPVQAGAPAFLAGEEGLYSILNATTGVNELYVHRQTVDAATDIPLTASALSYNAKAACVNGWTYLPSGLLLKWGSANINGALGTVTPTVWSGGPNFSRVFTAYVTPFDTGAAVKFNCGLRTSPNNTSGNFTVYATGFSASTGLIYLVIGV
jgi:hypothetical protein